MELRIRSSGKKQTTKLSIASTVNCKFREVQICDSLFNIMDKELDVSSKIYFTSSHAKVLSLNLFGIKSNLVERTVALSWQRQLHFT